MKVALVMDWLTNTGGAERVLQSLHRLYPDAPIYTSQYRPKKIDWFKDAKVKTGWLNLFPACLRRFIGPLRQIYFSRLDLSGYDLVISVTGAEAKAVKATGKHGKATHFCYCHVPTQYYWCAYDQYIEHPGFGFLDPLARFGLKLLVKPLRQADYRSAQRPDYFISISEYAADQIKTYYDREVKVIHPPVATEVFRNPVENSKIKSKNVKGKKPEQASNNRGNEALGEAFKKGYYINFSRQVSWKRLDLAVKACLKTHRPLLLIGDGPEHAKLVKLAQGSKNIVFLPAKPQSELKQYLAGAKAFIFPSREPFGIAPLEALAAGCPVIAYGEGGALDYIEDGKNGLLFPRQSINSLVGAMVTFEELIAHPKDGKQSFPVKALRQSAERFSEQHFQTNIKEYINDHLPKA